MMRSGAVLLIPVLLVGATLACGGGESPRAVVSPEQVDAALELAREGREEQAVTELERIVEADPGGPIGSRAGLVLGNLLLQRREAGRAAEVLERAVTGPVARPYGQVLLARAIVEGNLEAGFPEASALMESLAGSAETEVRPLLAFEARFLLFRLHLLQRRFEEAVRIGRGLAEDPRSGDRLDEIRWRTAEALRESGQVTEALDLAERIWIETPGSPWAVSARDMLRSLAPASGRVPRRLAPEERYEFAKRLRQAGLHAEAVEELDALLAAHAQHEKADEALFLRTQSLYQLRKNRECVETADRLRSRHPSSPWIPAAQVWAIQALRRGDAVEEVRRRAEALVSRYPGHPKSIEALYGLGVLLGNVGREEEGIRTLHRVVESGRDHENVTDALWKIAWFERGRGDTGTAAATLDRLVAAHPKSGYRKGSLYWLGQFLLDRDPARARALLEQTVAEFPNDYYGHQALETLRSLGGSAPRIGSGRAMPPLDLLTDPGRIQDPAGSYRQAANLRSIGLYDFAAAELAALPQLATDPALKFALADLQSRGGNPWKAIDTLNAEFREFVLAGTRGDESLVPKAFWQILYPFRYRAEIEKALGEEEVFQRTRIDPWMVAALIRMESRFLPTAVSPVGAIGLMQLMPDTAVKIAAARNQPAPTREQLFRPEVNIRFGTYYLANRVRDFGEEWFPAICSYNAGVDPVRGWWAKRPADLGIDEFIERIPYAATRLYIKQILGDYQNYRFLYPERG